MLFAATTNNALVALDPQSGRMLWTSASSRVGGSIGAIHWESPIVVDGWLYCPDETGHMLAFHR